MSKKKDDLPIQKKKPFAFAPVPSNPSSKPPIWHDGKGSRQRLSGELRCTLRNHTPLLVGWERNLVGEIDPAKLPAELRDLPDEKAVLYPLRMPSEGSPVLIPGDSLKGLLRHELGALLGAPMERVEERRYSYRPNMMFPDDPPDRFLEPRLAKVIASDTFELDGVPYPYPTEISICSELLTRGAQKYLPRTERGGRIHPKRGDHPYRSGMGAGESFAEEIYPNDEAGKRKVPEVRTHVRLAKDPDHFLYKLPSPLIEQYKRTLLHYRDKEAGHFSSRHPSIGDATSRSRAIDVVQRGAERAFRRDDVIWVEWNLETKQVTSFGWHYYYRWAYRDTVRTHGPSATTRRELSAAADELDLDSDGRPRALTSVRRLFGYVSDEKEDAELVRGIGRQNYSQLMGRVSINAALEDLSTPRTEAERFLPPVFLRELGQPRPSAVEHYLVSAGQPRSDQAMHPTYGDAADKDGKPLDPPGELAGRKLYLHRPGAQYSEDKAKAKDNERSTVALDASRPEALFRFTVRFRDLEADELAALMLALCPNQFSEELPRELLPTGRSGKPPYLSKLGYARPLGWGSVEIRVAELQLLEDFATQPRLAPQDARTWFRATWPRDHSGPLDATVARRWFELHQWTFDEAGDYPVAKEAKEDPAPRGRAASRTAAQDEPQIYAYHTRLRSQHARDRRYRKPR